jgi:hypothetical protein
MIVRSSTEIALLMVSATYIIRNKILQQQLNCEEQLKTLPV